MVAIIERVLKLDGAAAADSVQCTATDETSIRLPTDATPTPFPISSVSLRDFAG